MVNNRYATHNRVTRRWLVKKQMILLLPETECSIKISWNSTTFCFPFTFLIQVFSSFHFLPPYLHPFAFSWKSSEYNWSKPSQPTLLGMMFLQVNVLHSKTWPHNWPYTKDKPESREFTKTTSSPVFYTTRNWEQLDSTPSKVLLFLSLSKQPT